MEEKLTAEERIKREKDRLGLSKEVEKIYQKIIQSMELYTADNLPFITEFLEF